MLAALFTTWELSYQELGKEGTTSDHLSDLLTSLYVANRLAPILLQKGNPKAVEDLLLLVVKIHT